MTYSKYKDPEKRKAYEKAWRQEHREQVNARARQRCAEHPERRAKHAAYEREWRANNPSRWREIKERCEVKHKAESRARKSAYRALHKEELSAKYRVWRLANPDKSKVSYTRWRREHPERVRQTSLQYRKCHADRIKELSKERVRRYHERHGYIHQQKRRALKRGATTGPIDLNAIMERDRMTCGICHRKVKTEDLSFDHIIPLSKGGAHVQDNLQVAHRRCNSRRGAGYLPAQIRMSLT